MRKLKTDICVAGGGSGGFSAACAAARSGLKVLLFESETMLGGTSTVAGVNCWEPVTGAMYGLPHELYDRMSKIANGCGIYTPKLHKYLADEEHRDFPEGLNVVNRAMTYEDTLKIGYDHTKPTNQAQWNGVVFEPEAWDLCARLMLKESGCHIMTGHRAMEVKCSGEHITSVILDDGTEIESTIWIDNCGYLASASGCHILLGSEPQEMFHEPDAPNAPSVSNLNGVTLIFRVTPKDSASIDTLPEHLANCESSSVNMVAVEYPNGDLCCNMLPTLRGMDYLALGEIASRKCCEDRALAFWHNVQTEYEMLSHYTFKSFAPKLGVRETFRTVCDVMLTENDVLNGVANQDHSDLVVMSDHHLDRHGARGPYRPVRPYGISYRSLLPTGKDNLLVAGRIAGFSCLAATSCRLARTIMRLGEAAGYAAAMAVQDQKSLRTINIQRLQELIKFKEEMEISCLAP